MAAHRDLQISARRVVPGRCLRARFSRAGGPGGQNVNKVNTRVELVLDLDCASEAIGESAVARIRRKLQGRIDAKGRLVVASQRTRSQARNLEFAARRMEELLGEALARQAARRATRPTRASRQRRLEDKRARSNVKSRRRVDPSDY